MSASAEKKVFDLARKSGGVIRPRDLQRKRLPLDFQPNPAAHNSEASAETVSVIFDEGETATFLTALPAKSIRGQDALLTALAHALTGWTQSSVHTIDIESHGREAAELAKLDALPTEPDLTRTIGWFTGG